MEKKILIMVANNKPVLQPELESLRVYGETQVGWDEKVPPNETVDADGNVNPSHRGFGVADPNSPNRRVYSDPGVEALRSHLRQYNGIRGLEVCAQHEIKRAARIFHRDGFVVVRDLLNVEQLHQDLRWMADVLRHGKVVNVVRVNQHPHAT